LGSPFSQGLNKAIGFTQYLLFTLVIIGCTGAAGFGLCLCLLILTYALRHLMLQRISGVTGDTAGATIEIAEAFSFIFILMFTNSL